MLEGPYNEGRYYVQWEIMKKDFTLSSIKVGGLLLGFVLQLYFTRTIGLKEYGTYILFSTWINVFSLVLILGFDKVVIKQVSYYYLQNEKGKFRYTVDKLIKLMEAINKISSPTAATAQYESFETVGISGLCR